MNGRNFYKIFASLVLLCVCAVNSFANDQTQKATVGKGGIEDATVRNDSVADADSPGVQLARQHLAELLPLLSHLRTHEPGQYDKAIRELDRAAKRLETQQRRGNEFFDVALRQWQSRGRIDLLKAKLRIRPSESDRKRLLAEMQSLREVEVERLRLEWEVLAQRQQALAARVAQAEAASKRAEEQMEELNQNIQRLSSQQIDDDWPPYRRAAGLDRDPESAKKSNKAETIKPNPSAKQRMNDAKI
jgi:chromosome segregation ATPase